MLHNILEVEQVLLKPKRVINFFQILDFFQKKVP